MKSVDSFSSKQVGSGAWGLLLVAFLAGLVGLVIIKVFPSVYDGLSIQRIFEELPEDERIKSGTTKTEILDNISKKMIVNGIRSFDKKKIKVVKNAKEKTYVVTFDYEKRVPIFRHFDALIWFNNAATVPAK